MKKIRKMMWTVCYLEMADKTPYPFAMYLEIPEKGFFVYSTYPNTELPHQLLNPGEGDPIGVSESTAGILVEEEKDSVVYDLNPETPNEEWDY